MAPTPSLRIARFEQPRAACSPQLEIRLYSASRDHFPHRCLVGTQLSQPHRQAILRLRNELLSQQVSAGGWCEKVDDPRSISRWLMLLAYLGYEESPRASELAERLWSSQLASGGWSNQQSGMVDLNTSLMAYLALKRTQGAAAIGALRQARQQILSYGGARAAVGEAAAWLALFGQIDRSETDEAPPQVRDALARASIVKGCPTHGIGELFIAAEALSAQTETAEDLPSEATLAWKRVALSAADADAAQREIVDAEIERRLASFDGDSEPERSLIATATALHALIESGVSHDDLTLRSSWQTLDDFTADPQQLTPFEAASALGAIAADAQPTEDVRFALPPNLTLWSETSDSGVGEVAIDRQAVSDRLAMRLDQTQNDDGGWASTLGGPSCVAATAAALAALARVKHAKSAACERAAQWLRRQQRLDGSWHDARGGIHATAVAVGALAAISTADEAMLAGANWLMVAGDESIAEPTHFETAATTARALIAAGLANVELIQSMLSSLIDCVDDANLFARDSIDATTLSAMLAALAQGAVSSPASRENEPAVCLRVVRCGTVGA